MNYLLRLRVLAITLLMICFGVGNAVAGGPFGSPQPVAKESGGLHTGIGYWRQDGVLENGSAFGTAGNHGYSEVGYSFLKSWEIYARLGISDLKILGGFSSLTPSTITAKNDFEENTNYFGTVGIKSFYPINRALGWGAFVQGSYYFRDFADEVSGSQNGIPFKLELRVSDLWDVNIGVGLQAMTTRGIKFYGGPFAYHAEAKSRTSGKIPGLPLTTADGLRNRTFWGGFAGVEAPLAKGFSLHMEGQYSARLSAGTAVTFSY